MPSRRKFEKASDALRATPRNGSTSDAVDTGPEIGEQAGHMHFVSAQP
jgi:hypothetical protein